MPQGQYTSADVQQPAGQYTNADIAAPVGAAPAAAQPQGFFQSVWSRAQFPGAGIPLGQGGLQQPLAETQTPSASAWEDQKAAFKGAVNALLDTVQHPSQLIPAWETIKNTFTPKEVEQWQRGDYSGAVGTALMDVANLSPATGAVLSKAAPALEQSALTQYGRVLSPTTQANKYLTRTQVAPGLVERGVTAVSLKGLQQTVADNVARVGQAIGDAWADLPEGTTVELQPVLDSLDKSATEAFTVPARSGPLQGFAAPPPIPTSAYAKNALDTVEGLKQTLTNVAEKNPQTGALEVPVERLHTLRAAWDDIAAQAKVYSGQQLADYAQGKIHAMSADAIRDELGQQFPDIDALNKEYSFWKNTQQVVDATVQRRMGQAKPLGRKLASAAGTVGGFATGGMGGAVLGREVMDGLEAVTTSPAWNTVSAVVKDRLADSLASGDASTALRIIGNIGRNVGQAAQGEEQPSPMATAVAVKP